MPLDANSTTAQVLDAWATNANYAENDSLSEARAFASAVRQLLSPRHSMKRSAAGGRGGTEIELDPPTLLKQLEDANVWISQKLAANGGGVIHADFTGYRE